MFFMNSSNDDFLNWLPKLQSHRGYWVEGITENTLKSVQKAYEIGYEICEFDVRLTKDEQVILFHDHSYNEKDISDYNFSDLNKLIEVNTLDELLGWFSSVENFKLNIEIKSAGKENLVLEKIVLQLIQKYKIESRVLISSFNPISLAYFKNNALEVYRAQLVTFESHQSNSLLLKSLMLNYLVKPHVVHIRAEDYLNSFYAKMILKQTPVVLWTVNDISIYEQLKSNIHGIISDEILPASFRSSI